MGSEEGPNEKENLSEGLRGGEPGGLARVLIRGIRRWTRRPGLAALILASMVLGVGLNTAVFTLLDSAFLHPWPIADLEPLTMIHVTRRNAAGEPGGIHRHAYPDLQDLRQRQKSFVDLAAFHWWPMSFSGGSEPVRTKGMYVSAGYFELLGLAPAAGRFFLPDDDAPGAAGDVVVLAHGTWGRLFGGDSEVLGKTVRVNGRPMTVIGVAPKGFVGTELPNAIDFFLPVAAFPHISPWASYFEQRGTSAFSLLGRLRPGVSRQEANSELAGLAHQLEAEFPKEGEGLGYRVVPLREAGYRPGDRDRYLGYGGHLLLGAVLVLLITGIDVAALLLGRALERRREMALELALGASRWQLVKGFGVEYFLVLGAGGLLALPAAWAALEVLWRLRPPQIEAELFDLSLDFRALGVALGLTLAMGGCVALIALWRGTRVHPAEALRGIRQLDGAGAGSRWRDPLRWLVVLQVALALAALMAAGWLSQAERSAREIEPGFDADRLAVVSLAPGEAGWEPQQIEDFLRRLQAEAAALPGVSSVAISENQLLRGGVSQREIVLPGGDEPLVIGERNRHRTNAVLPGFFETVGIPLLAGEDFDPLLSADGKKVVIINRTLAETVWPGEDAIGRQLHFDYAESEPLEVVGVVEDARYRNLREPRQFFLYLPMAQEPRSSMTLHVRVDSAAPATVLPALRQLLNDLAPELPLGNLLPLSTVLDDDLWLDRASARLMKVFTGLAWLLAALGIYGAMGRSVTRRLRELGIRRALGAGSWQVLAPVVREALGVVLVGAVLAVPLVALLARMITPTGWGAALLPALVVVPIVILACWLPCRRALTVTPAEVLRDE